MRRLLAIAIAVGALAAVSASPAFAAGKNPPTSCGIGFAVSEAAKEFGGLGKFFHELGAANLGEVLKPLHEEIKETC